MLLVGWWPKTRQGFECGIPHAELAPACEAHKDRIPITVSLGHVAPRSAGAQNPENTVDRSPLVRDRWTTFAPIGEQRVENAPFRVRYIAPTQCCLLQKGSLESKLDSSVKNRQHALVHLRKPTIGNHLAWTPCADGGHRSEAFRGARANMVGRCATSAFDSRARTGVWLARFKRKFRSDHRRMSVVLTRQEKPFQ